LAKEGLVKHIKDLQKKRVIMGDMARKPIKHKSKRSRKSQEQGKEKKDWCQKKVVTGVLKR